MNCREFEADIALYVEGDVLPDRAVKLERHLAVCVQCRTLADELRESQASIRQLRNEVVDTASLNWLHATVLAQVREIEDRRTIFERASIWMWGAFRFRYVVLGCLVLILSGLGVRYLRHPMVQPTAAVLQVVQDAAPLEKIPITTVAKCCVETHRNRLHRSLPESVPTAKTLESVPVIQTEAETLLNSAESQHEDLRVQILTDDPSVVIYWLIDQKTGGH